MKPQVDLFSFRFLEEIEDTKKTFRNYLTFSDLKNFVILGLQPRISKVFLDH